MRISLMKHSLNAKSSRVFRFHQGGRLKEQLLIAKLKACGIQLRTSDNAQGAEGEASRTDVQIVMGELPHVPSQMGGVKPQVRRYRYRRSG
jgi:hypothetical protein